jgi:hypothetical protein
MDEPEQRWRFGNTLDYHLQCNCLSYWTANAAAAAVAAAALSW